MHTLHWMKKRNWLSFWFKWLQLDIPTPEKDVLATVQNILDSKGSNNTVSRGWLDRFQKQHPELSVKVAVPLSKARAFATDPETLQKYIGMLEACMNENDIDGSNQIFNCDETGCPSTLLQRKSLHPRGQSTQVTSREQTRLKLLYWHAHVLVEQHYHQSSYLIVSR